MNDIHWWQIIGRVSRGLGTADDAQAISEHLALGDVARQIRATGGDAGLARRLRVNLGFVRRLSLAKHGFREVRRADIRPHGI